MSIKPYDHISSLKQIFEFGDLSVNASSFCQNHSIIGYVICKITEGQIEDESDYSKNSIVSVVT